MRQRHALVDRVQTPADPSQSELDGPPVELRAPSSAATRDGVHEQDQGDDDHRSDGDDGDGGRGDDHATFLSWNSRVETNLARISPKTPRWSGTEPQGLHRRGRGGGV